jgi:serine protease Do
MTEELAKALGVKDQKGVVVTNVTQDSPAKKAGMKSGDVIVEIKGEKIDDGRKLRSVVANLEPGAAVSCKVIREKKKHNFKIKIGTMPGDIDKAVPTPSGEKRKTKLGIDVSPLDARMKQRLGVPELEGVVVAHVQSDSPASGVLRSGDVITEINHEKIRDMKEFEAKTKSLKKGNDLLFRVFRSGAWVYLVLRL